MSDSLRNPQTARRLFGPWLLLWLALAVPGLAAATFPLPIPTRPTTFPLARPTRIGSLVAFGETDFGATVIPPDVTNVVVVAAGNSSSVVLQADGKAISWGWGATGAFSDVCAISAGDKHVVVLTSSGRVETWGQNTRFPQTFPTAAQDVVGISSKWWHDLALRRDGTVLAWGYSALEQTVVPNGLSNVVKVAAGGYHSLALKSDGTVVGWGYNGDLQLPMGQRQVADIAAGLTFSLVLQRNGRILAFGKGANGQVVTVPAGLKPAVAIEAGYRHCVAIHEHGEFTVWGDLPGLAERQGLLPGAFSPSIGSGHMLVLRRQPPPLIAIFRNSSSRVTLRFEIPGQQPQWLEQSKDNAEWQRVALISESFAEITPATEFGTLLFRLRSE